jgi:acetyl CoA:N6-hydroxylysine acetyl transferase
MRRAGIRYAGRNWHSPLACICFALMSRKTFAMRLEQWQQLPPFLINNLPELPRTILQARYQSQQPWNEIGTVINKSVSIIKHHHDYGWFLLEKFHKTDPLSHNDHPHPPDSFAPMIHCKPLHHEIVFSKFVDDINATVEWRSLNLEEDIERLHTWVNAPYTKRFWKLDATLLELEDLYKRLLKDPYRHAFTGLVNGESFCHIEIYALHTDVLHEHVPEADLNDCGLHILMCPPRQLKKGWSPAALRTFMEYYFSFGCPYALYAEPDKDNRHANTLAIECGFEYLKTVQLPDKTANLYCARGLP